MRRYSMNYISLESLTLIPINAKNQEHINVLNSFENDGITCHNLSYSLLELTDKIPKMKVNNHFIVYDGLMSIGYVTFFPILESKVHTFSLHYAVLSQHRNQHYGREILKQVGAYLLKNPNIERVGIHIDNENQASIRCAVAAGFSKHGEYFELKSPYKVGKNR